MHARRAQPRRPDQRDRRSGARAPTSRASRRARRGEQRDEHEPPRAESSGRRQRASANSAASSATVQSSTLTPYGVSRRSTSPATPSTSPEPRMPSPTFVSPCTSPIEPPAYEESVRGGGNGAPGVAREPARPQTFAIVGSPPSPDASIETASTSPLIQSACSASRSAYAGGSVTAIRSVSSRPASRRRRFSSWIEVEDAALELELGVERRVERDRDAVLGRDRPALAADPLDEHLVRLELVAGRRGSGRRRAPRTRPPASAARTLAELLAELRAEHGQVRLHAQLGRLDVAELDLLHAQLVGDLVRVRRAAPAPRDDEPPQRLAQLQPRGRARPPAELDDPPHLGHLGEQRLVRPRPARASRRGRPTRRVRARAGDEVPPQVLGEERHHRRDHAQRLHERVPERPERGVVVAVEAAPRAADVPVREVVDERLEGADDVDGQDRLVARRRLARRAACVRATSQRSSGAARRPARRRARRTSAAKPSMFA